MCGALALNKLQRCKNYKLQTILANNKCNLARLWKTLCKSGKVLGLSSGLGAHASAVSWKFKNKSKG